MDNQLNNGFCPECGALLRDGVCPSCGYGAGQGQEGAADGFDGGYASADANQTYAGQTDPNQTYEGQTDVNQTGAGQTDAAGQPAGGTEPRNYEKYQAAMNNNMNQNGYYQNNADPNNMYNQNNADPNNMYYQNNANPNNMYYQNGYGGQQQQQNMYYQQPGANNYYGNQVPQEKKSKKGVVIAVVIAIVLCVGLLIALIALAVSAVKSASSVDDTTYTYEDSNGNEFSFGGDDEEDDFDISDDDEDEWDSDMWDTEGTGSYDEDLLAFVDDIDWNDTSWMEEPENYTPEEVYDDYYECYISLCSCIDENVSYEMVHTNWEEVDEDQNVCIRVNYYQLEGDIPNLDEINEELRYQAAWPGDIYFSMSDEFEDEFDEYGPGYVVSVDSYVTYNDEEKISVVSDIYYESATSVRKLLYGVNIDLTTGEIMKNNRMLDISDEFLEEYKDICEYQNGTVSIFDELDNDELREFFEDRDDLIIYYTPCGLEVGINYETDERYGWVSATLVDYEQYLR